MTVRAIREVTGLLAVSGDYRSNSIILRRTIDGRLTLNDDAVIIADGPATTENTQAVEIFASQGHDRILFWEANGPLPDAIIFGGAGHDRIHAGSGDDLLNGDGGDDRLMGNRGNDELRGGDGSDHLDGGPGDDQLHGESGDDRLAWTSGGGSDLIGGGEGVDTLVVTGASAADLIALEDLGEGVKLSTALPAPAELTIHGVEHLVVAGRAGNDRITATGSLAGVTQLSVSGGIGNDRIEARGLSPLVRLTSDGGDGRDTLIGGSGNDVLAGGRGHDIIQGGEGDDLLSGDDGDDRFVWRSGDGSDRIEGGEGEDSIEVIGSDSADIFEMDEAAQRIGIRSGGGAGASLELVALEAALLEGGGGNDRIDAGAVSGAVSLTLSGGAGDDELVGGRGDDLLLGGDGRDRVGGGGGRDTVRLGRGDDLFVWILGDGSDAVTGWTGADEAAFEGGDGTQYFRLRGVGVLARADIASSASSDSIDLTDVETISWRPMAGADEVAVEDLSGTAISRVAIDLDDGWTAGGYAQADRVSVFATAAADTVLVSAPGGQVTIAGLAAETVLINGGVEDEASLLLLAGADTVRVDASSAWMPTLSIDLAGSPGRRVADGDADRILVELGDLNDSWQIAGTAGAMGLGDHDRRINVVGVDQKDVLVVNGGGGHDNLLAEHLGTFAARVELHGGAGDDAIVGSAGDDVASGGEGFDYASLGAGDDRFIWQAGDGHDVLHGGAGHDVLDYGAGDGAASIAVRAVGVDVFVGEPSGQLQVRTFEELRIDAGAGSDRIEFADLVGTGVLKMVIDVGAHDGAVDTIVFLGEPGELSQVREADGSVRILGLGYELTILNLEAHDALFI